MNRRMFAKLATLLTGIPRAILAKPVEVKPQCRDVSIAMRFEYEGKHYGLRVPVYWDGFESTGRAEIVDGEQIITLSDDRVKLLIQMLHDLRWSRSETIRELAHGCYDENRAFEVMPNRATAFRA